MPMQDLITRCFDGIIKDGPGMAVQMDVMSVIPVKIDYGGSL